MSFTNNPRIVTNGLVFSVDALDKNSYASSSTVWYDLSGNNNNGTLTNGPYFDNSDEACINFDGVNDYVILTRPSQLVTGGPISISLWAKWLTKGTSQTDIQALVDNNHNASQGFVIQDRPDLSGKPLTFSVIRSTNGVSSSFTVGDGNWRYIVATNDGISSSLYIDGALSGATLESGGVLLVQPSISLGYWQNIPGRYLSGSIANVQIYNRALSKLEVTQNYNLQKSRFGL